MLSNFTYEHDGNDCFLICIKCQSRNISVKKCIGQLEDNHEPYDYSKLECTNCSSFDVVDGSLIV